MTAKPNISALAHLIFFGVAFGLLEASVVVYLREIAQIGSGGLFPINFQPPAPLARVFAVERWRELSTLALMGSAAWMAAKTPFDRFLAFLLVFGVWDISYYLFLIAFTGWPPSWMTYDVLFLWPTLWVAPVLCPMLVSGGFIGFSLGYFNLVAKRIPRPPHPALWACALVGALLVFWAFIQEAGYYQAGGLPPRFNWPLFLTGYLAALGSGLYYLYSIFARPKAKFF